MTVPRQSVQLVDSPTERRNAATADIDRMSTAEILRRINNEDQAVPYVVAAALPGLVDVVDRAVVALRSGRRVHYVGAGTSGRLATLDVAELGPTYDIPADWFVVHHAGGPSALFSAAEGAEDDEEAGATDLARTAHSGDVVIGLAASGRTPFVLGALAAARAVGAYTVLVSNNPDTMRPAYVDNLITVNTGPEVISGSTRMKAGTAQKLVLNSFSTAVMVRMGRTYSNLMVSMRASNAKLRGRSLRILSEATGMGRNECSDALIASHGDVRVALVHLLAGVDVRTAALALRENGGHVRDTLGQLIGHLI